LSTGAVPRDLGRGAASRALTESDAWGMTRRGMKSTTPPPAAVDIASVQMARKLGLLVTLTLFCVLFVFGGTRWAFEVHETMRWIGGGLIFICISGRTWCSLYIGGRKNYELVTAGPYSVCRNPLYVFSIIGGVGAAAQLGAVTVAVLGGVCAWLVHILVVRQEERLLLAEHGEAYAKYLAGVPRFFPRFSLWRNVDVLEVRPRAFARTFGDACLFLGAIPIGGALDLLHHLGLLRVFFRLP
jgi:protein-S-isoprenylcysteine O-methyltransferase Ste14